MLILPVKHLNCNLHNGVSWLRVYRQMYAYASNQLPCQSFVDVSVSYHSFVCTNFGKQQLPWKAKCVREYLLSSSINVVNVMRRTNVETLFDSSIRLPTYRHYRRKPNISFSLHTQKIRYWMVGIFCINTCIEHRYIFFVVLFASRTELKKRKIHNKIDL